MPEDIPAPACDQLSLIL